MKLLEPLSLPSFRLQNRVVMAPQARARGDEVHVAHIVIDGGIDGQRLLSRAPNLRADGLLNVDAIAETFLVHAQSAPQCLDFGT